LEIDSVLEIEAASQVVLPACDAVMMVVPALRMVTLLPEIEATVGSELVKTKGSRDVVDATRS
jgi:hypothetical protein